MTLNLENASDAEQLFILERLSWSDQAATAAEVTALQIFRDLFSSEALRPGDQISVGTLTVLFTDLRNSTRLYRDIGDATAFGRVMNHFDVLKRAIAEADGALVKTIGDAVMGVFRNPASALTAMLQAQEELAAPPEGTAPLTLKAGIHIGPCIAVTLNERLDYFGSTVNMAARLEGLSTGNDVVISAAVYNDPEVRELLNAPEQDLEAAPFVIELKGFDQEQFDLWRIVRKSARPKFSSLKLSLKEMPAILEAKDVSKIYQMGSTNVAALDHVSLTIEEGEFAAIQGTSGSGKSTLSTCSGDWIIRRAAMSFSRNVRWAHLIKKRWPATAVIQWA